MRIPAPSLPPGHVDRGIDCEEALEAAVADLCEAAEAAGWTATEVDAAFVGLVEARVAMRQANAETDAAVAAARRKVSQ